MDPVTTRCHCLDVPEGSTDDKRSAVPGDEEAPLSRVGERSRTGAALDWSDGALLLDADSRRRRYRRLQSWYRHELLRAPYGWTKGRRGTSSRPSVPPRPVGSLLEPNWTRSNPTANFLARDYAGEILTYAQRDVLATGGSLDPARLHTNMLSSMPLRRRRPLAFDAAYSGRVRVRCRRLPRSFNGTISFAGTTGPATVTPDAMSRSPSSPARSSSPSTAGSSPCTPPDTTPPRNTARLPHLEADPARTLRPLTLHRVSLPEPIRRTGGRGSR